MTFRYYTPQFISSLTSSQPRRDSPPPPAYNNESEMHGHQQDYGMQYPHRFGMAHHFDVTSHDFDGHLPPRASTAATPPPPPVSEQSHSSFGKLQSSSSLIASLQRQMQLNRSTGSGSNGSFGGESFGNQRQPVGGGGDVGVATATGRQPQQLASMSNYVAWNPQSNSTYSNTYYQHVPAPQPQPVANSNNNLPAGSAPSQLHHSHSRYQSTASSGAGALINASVIGGNANSGSYYTHGSRSGSQQPNQGLLLPSHQTLTNVTATASPTESTPATASFGGVLVNRSNQYSPLGGGSSRSSLNRPTPTSPLPEAVSPSYFSNNTNPLSQQNGELQSASGFGAAVWSSGSGTTTGLGSDGDLPYVTAPPVTPPQQLRANINYVEEKEPSASKSETSLTAFHQHHHHHGLAAKSTNSSSPLHQRLRRLRGEAPDPSKGGEQPGVTFAEGAVEQGGQLMSSETNFGSFSNTVVMKPSDDFSERRGDFDPAEAAPGLLASRAQSVVERSGSRSKEGHGWAIASQLNANRKQHQQQQQLFQNAVSSKVLGASVSASALLRCNSIRGNGDNNGAGHPSSSSNFDDECNESIKDAATIGGTTQGAPPLLPPFMRNTASECSGATTMNSPTLAGMLGGSGNNSIHAIGGVGEASTSRTFTSAMMTSRLQQYSPTPPRQASTTPSTNPDMVGTAESSKTTLNTHHTTTSGMSSVADPRGISVGGSVGRTPQSSISVNMSVSQPHAARGHNRAATEPVRPLHGPASSASSFATAAIPATTGHMAEPRPTPVSPSLPSETLEGNSIITSPKLATHQFSDEFNFNNNMGTNMGSFGSPAPNSPLTSDTNQNSGTPHPQTLPIVAAVSSPTSLSIGALTPPRNLSFGSSAPATNSFHLSSVGNTANLHIMPITQGHQTSSNDTTTSSSLLQRQQAMARGTNVFGPTAANSGTDSGGSRQTGINSSSTVEGSLVGQQQNGGNAAQTPGGSVGVGGGGFMTPLHLHTPLLAANTNAQGGSSGDTTAYSSSFANITNNNGSMAQQGAGQQQQLQQPVAGSPAQVHHTNTGLSKAGSSTSSYYASNTVVGLPPVYTNPATTSTTPKTSATPTSAESRFVFASNTITNTSSGLNTNSAANTSQQQTSSNSPTLATAAVSSPTSLHAQPQPTSFGRSISWSPPRGRSVLEQISFGFPNVSGAGVGGAAEGSVPPEHSPAPERSTVMASQIGMPIGLSRDQSAASTPTAVSHLRPPLAQTRFTGSASNNNGSSLSAGDTSRSLSAFIPHPAAGGAAAASNSSNLSPNTANSAPTTSNAIPGGGPGRSPLPQYPPLPPSIIGSSAARAAGGGASGGWQQVASGYGRSVNIGGTSVSNNGATQYASSSNNSGAGSSTLYTMSLPNENSGSRNVTTKNNSPIVAYDVNAEVIGATVKKGALLDAVRASRFNTRAVLVDACSTSKGSNSVFGLDREAGQQLRQSSKFARKRQIAADRSFIRSLHTSFLALSVRVETQFQQALLLERAKIDSQLQKEEEAAAAEAWAVGLDSAEPSRQSTQQFHYQGASPRGDGNGSADHAIGDHHLPAGISPTDGEPYKTVVMRWTGEGSGDHSPKTDAGGGGGRGRSAFTGSPHSDEQQPQPLNTRRGSQPHMMHDHTWCPSPGGALADTILLGTASSEGTLNATSNEKGSSRDAFGSPDTLENEPHIPLAAVAIDSAMDGGGATRQPLQRGDVEGVAAAPDHGDQYSPGSGHSSDPTVIIAPERSDNYTFTGTSSGTPQSGSVLDRRTTTTQHVKHHHSHSHSFSHLAQQQQNQPQDNHDLNPQRKGSVHHNHHHHHTNPQQTHPIDAASDAYYSPPMNTSSGDKHRRSMVASNSAAPKVMHSTTTTNFNLVDEEEVEGSDEQLRQQQEQEQPRSGTPTITVTANGTSAAVGTNLSKPTSSNHLSLRRRQHPQQQQQNQGHVTRPSDLDEASNTSAALAVGIIRDLNQMPSRGSSVNGPYITYADHSLVTNNGDSRMSYTNNNGEGGRSINNTTFTSTSVVGGLHNSDPYQNGSQGTGSSESRPTMVSVVASPTTVGEGASISMSLGSRGFLGGTSGANGSGGLGYGGALSLSALSEKTHSNIDIISAAANSRSADASGLGGTTNASVITNNSNSLPLPYNLTPSIEAATRFHLVPASYPLVASHAPLSPNRVLDANSIPPLGAPDATSSSSPSQGRQLAEPRSSPSSNPLSPPPMTAPNMNSTPPLSSHHSPHTAPLTYHSMPAVPPLPAPPAPMRRPAPSSAQLLASILNPSHPTTYTPSPGTAAHGGTDPIRDRAERATFGMSFNSGMAMTPVASANTIYERGLRATKRVSSFKKPWGDNERQQPSTGHQYGHSVSYSASYKRAGETRSYSSGGADFLADTATFGASVVGGGASVTGAIMTSGSGSGDKDMAKASKRRSSHMHLRQTSDPTNSGDETNHARPPVPVPAPSSSSPGMAGAKGSVTSPHFYALGIPMAGSGIAGAAGFMLDASQNRSAPLSPDQHSNTSSRRGRGINIGGGNSGRGAGSTPFTPESPTLGPRRQETITSNSNANRSSPRSPYQQSKLSGSKDDAQPSLQESNSLPHYDDPTAPANGTNTKSQLPRIRAEAGSLMASGDLLETQPTTSNTNSNIHITHIKSETVYSGAGSASGTNGNLLLGMGQPHTTGTTSGYDSRGGSPLTCASGSQPNTSRNNSRPQSGPFGNKPPTPQYVSSSSQQQQQIIQQPEQQFQHRQPAAPDGGLTAVPILQSRRDSGAVALPIVRPTGYLNGSAFTADGSSEEGRSHPASTDDRIMHIGEAMPTATTASTAIASSTTADTTTTTSPRHAPIHPQLGGPSQNNSSSTATGPPKESSWLTMLAKKVAENRQDEQQQSQPQIAEVQMHSTTLHQRPPIATSPKGSNHHQQQYYTNQRPLPPSPHKATAQPSGSTNTRTSPLIPTYHGAIPIATSRSVAGSPTPTVITDGRSPSSQVQRDSASDNQAAVGYSWAGRQVFSDGGYDSSVYGGGGGGGGNWDRATDLDTANATPIFARAQATDSEDQPDQGQAFERGAAADGRASQLDYLPPVAQHVAQQQAPRTVPQRPASGMSSSDAAARLRAMYQSATDSEEEEEG